MGERGNVVLFIILGFVGILILPPLIMYLFPEAKLIFQLLMVFIIYSTVRGYLGAGTLTLVVSAVLIYFLAFKYIEITASLWVFQFLLMFGFTSVVVWGIGTRMKPQG